MHFDWIKDILSLRKMRNVRTNKTIFAQQRRYSLHNNNHPAAVFSTGTNLVQVSLGLATAYHRAQNRRAWSVLVGTAATASRQVTRWRWRCWSVVAAEYRSRSADMPIAADSVDATPRSTPIEIKETGVRLGRRSIQPAVSPADGHLTTPTAARLPGLCENFRPTASKSQPNLTYPLSSHWATSPIALSGQEY